MDLWTNIAAAISTATTQPFNIEAQHPVGGGCINQSFSIEGNGRRYFAKLNEARNSEMFEAEADALHSLRATNTVRAPEPICWGTISAKSYLILEHLDLGRSGSDCAEVLGMQLAQLHRHTGPHYGWHRNNTIGTTPQPNEASQDWLTFWRERRLGWQLKVAEQRGYGGSVQRKGERLLIGLDHILDDHAPPTSLLHGDLWSGNYDSLADGNPVIFDPASYYGDRETDIAMTELFGGFSPRFYAAYRDHYPLDSGYRLRKTLYNLYHILNHANLFGGGYIAQAEHMMDSLLSEVN